MWVFLHLPIYRCHWCMTPLLVGGEAWKGLVKNNRKLVTGTFTCSEVLNTTGILPVLLVWALLAGVWSPSFAGCNCKSLHIQFCKLLLPISYRWQQHKMRSYELTNDICMCLYKDWVFTEPTTDVDKFDVVPPHCQAVQDVAGTILKHIQQCQAKTLCQ